MKGEYVGGIHNTVHEEGKLYLFYPDDSFDIIDLEGEKQMKDHRQIDGLIRQMTECLENAYNRGYKQGIADGNINDDEIRVGDEVYSETYGEKGVVTKVWENSDIIILSSNCSMIRTPKNKVKKTGKHYDEMEKLLEKMRGE